MKGNLWACFKCKEKHTLC